MFVVGVFILANGFLAYGFPARRAAAEEPITFEKHIRPILKRHCFICHGESGRREGELDVRLRRLIATGGDSGVGLVPHQPAESLLLQRIRDEEMPPGDTKLSAKDITLIERWISAGAPTARQEPESIGDGPFLTQEELSLWSFQPIRRAALPQVKAAGAVRSPVDAFVLSRLEKENLSFSPRADRRTLIRRASFDLLGLPPTPEEIQAFLADAAPNAYERLIDRLLASPHYGEHWGRHWLDVAGYADSEGYTESDTVRPWAYRYRDYVIRSLNADKPFNLFIQEQLAGDEMAPPETGDLSPRKIEQLTATGFLRMAPDGTGSGGIDQDVARNGVVADTIKIVSSSLLGLTVGCAQCHDHRYDPISQVDYYRMRAIFEPAYDWKHWKAPNARRVSLYTEADRAMAKKINAEAAVVDQERAEKAKMYIARTLEEELLKLPEEKRAPLRLAYQTPAKERTDEQKALLKTRPSIAQISTGSLYLYDRERHVRAAKLDAQRKALEKTALAETRKQELEKAPEALRETLRKAAALAANKRNPEQTALLNQYAGAAATLATLAQFNAPAAEQIKQYAAQAKALRDSLAAVDLKRYSDRAAKIRQAIPRELFLRVLTETPQHVAPTFVFHRGDYEQPKQEVQPGRLAALSQTVAGDISVNNEKLPTTGRRLAFAQQLTDPRHPLAARVIVNRIWLNHFGRGIVASPSDFGLLGQRPTHPQLLDWLAADFVAGGWQVKRLHRLIMTSAVYQQSSRRRPEHDAVDPDNKLYGRMSIRRLEAEIVRDAMLAASGELVFDLYGEPIPVMQDEVGQIVIGRENLDGERKPGSAVSLNGQDFRRSVYIQVRRSRPLSAMETFDSPTMDPNCESRVVSNVASQALMMMNSKLVLDYSARLAERLQADAGGGPENSSARIAQAWELVFGQPANEEERAAAAAFIAGQEQVFLSGDKKASAEIAQQRAWASFCQALLSSSRFLYVE